MLRIGVEPIGTIEGMQAVVAHNPDRDLDIPEHGISPGPQGVSPIADTEWTVRPGGPVASLVALGGKCLGGEGKPGMLVAQETQMDNPVREVFIEGTPESSGAGGVAFPVQAEVAGLQPGRRAGAAR